MKTRTPGLLALAVAAVGTVLWLGQGAEPERGSANLPDRRPRAVESAQAVEPAQGLAATVATEGDPGWPSAPPQPGRDVPPEPRPTFQPADAKRIRAEALARAVAEGAKRPGESAFRSMVTAFMQHNRAAAKRQAAREGLTTEEVEELTYFGLMVQESQRWADVEELVGHPIEEHVRVAGGDLMHDLNGEFKARMRALVERGATAGERWSLIREMQKRYRRAYFELTGMSDASLDMLLAGDASRAYAPASMSLSGDRPHVVEEEAPISVERPAAPPELLEDG